MWVNTGDGGLVACQHFWLRHTGDDEVMNVALAMKLDSCGMQGYNLYRVNMKISAWTEKQASPSCSLHPKDMMVCI
jgi:hypothetical protein